MSGNVNCKPPHAADVVAGRLFVNGNSIFEDGTKGEWFFDESRASVRQQLAADRKAARPQVRDQDFLAKKRRAAKYRFHKSVSDLPTSRMS